MNKKIILIQPNYPTSPFPDFRLPVGLGYLAEQLIIFGIDYEVVDMNFNDFQFLEDKIVSFNPDYIGISLMSLDIDYHYALISKIRNIFPTIKIIAGGPHISFMKEEALFDCSAINFGIVHEGEESFIELIKSDNPIGIKGVIYRDGEKIIYNGDRGFIQDLDKYRFPTYKKFDLARYGDKIDIISSRGCPFSCIFCGAHFSMGKKWRGRTAESIVSEIEFWYQTGYVDFNFVDSNFFFSKQRVIELCNQFKSKKLNIAITSDGMRGDDADVEMLQKMKESGLKLIAIGVESANEGILKNIKKGEELSQIEDAIKVCVALDINVILFFIIGLPGETKESVENSFKFALKYPVEDAYFFNVNPLPKTELYKWAEENKYLLTSKQDIFRNIGGMGEKPLIATPELSYDGRIKLYKKGLLVTKRVRRKYKRRKNIQKLKVLFNTVKGRIVLKLSIFKTYKSSQEKLANQIYTHLTNEEKTFLKHIASKVPRDGVILEVGSYLGASACFLALGCQKKCGKVFCVDTWQNEAMSEGERDTYEEFMENIKPYKDIITPLRGKSAEVAKKFDKKINLIFIDGDHSYKGVKADVDGWFPKLDKNAIVIFHDINWAEGVQRVVAEVVVPRAKKEGRLLNLYWALL
jgi:radical SAM superfamily enzyme YgiQ (UPF0313 family)